MLKTVMLIRNKQKCHGLKRVSCIDFQLTKLIFKDQEIDSRNERINTLEKKIYEQHAQKVIIGQRELFTADL